MLGIAKKATYQEFVQYMARLGFIEIETTETGYNELRTIGFSAEDMVIIESDMQAGFSYEESRDAIKGKGV